MKKKKVLDLLNFWLRPKDTLLIEFQDHILGADKTNRIFIDRKSDILFVAHIDTVHTPELRKHQNNRIWASGLDDRLGCAIAYELSKSWNVDLLICDHEESGFSSGQHHELKEYNWIAEFDRSGGDVVTYDLENDEFTDCLKEYFTIGWGTFSDLCLLKTKACCVNIGIGYKHDHSIDSFVDIGVLNNQLAKFRKFYHKNKTTKFVQDPEKMKNNVYQMFGAYSDFQYGFEKDAYDDYYKECDYCGNIGGTEIYGNNICPDCFDQMTSEFLYGTWAKNKYGNVDYGR